MQNREDMEKILFRKKNLAIMGEKWNEIYIKEDNGNIINIPAIIGSRRSKIIQNLKNQWY